MESLRSGYKALDIPSLIVYTYRYPGNPRCSSVSFYSLSKKPIRPPPSSNETTTLLPLTRRRNPCRKRSHCSSPLSRFINVFCHHHHHSHPIFSLAFTQMNHLIHRYHYLLVSSSDGITRVFLTELKHLWSMIDHKIYIVSSRIILRTRPEIDPKIHGVVYTSFVRQQQNSKGFVDLAQHISKQVMQQQGSEANAD